MKFLSHITALFNGKLQTCRAFQRISFKCNIFKPRYSKTDTLKERLAGMINQSNLKSKTLADTMLFRLKSLNLLLEKMIGQGYVHCPGNSEFSVRER